MASLPEHPDASLFPYCDAALGKFPDVPPIEGHYVTVPCTPGNTNIATCKKSDIGKHIKEVGGLNLNNVSLHPINFVVPEFVPIVEPAFFNLPSAAIPQNIVGVSLKDIFAQKMRTRYGKIRLSSLRIREELLKMPVFQRKQIILFGSSRDALIEPIWEYLLEHEIPDALARMGFVAATAFNFSIFDGECAVGQRINLKKSLKAAEYFEEAGLSAIPHIYFAHKQHLDSWIEWLVVHPHIDTVAMNCQFTRKDHIAKSTAEGIELIIQALSRPLKILLEGPSEILLADLHLRGLGSNISVGMLGPSKGAAVKVSYQLSGTKLIRGFRAELSPQERLSENLKIYEEYIRAKFLKGTPRIAISSVPTQQLVTASRIITP